MIEIFWSERYCYFNFSTIVYYPVTNRIVGRGRGHSFPVVRCQTIESLGKSEARELTCLVTGQL